MAPAELQKRKWLLAERGLPLRNNNNKKGGVRFAWPYYPKIEQCQLIIKRRRLVANGVY